MRCLPQVTHLLPDLEFSAFSYRLLLAFMGPAGCILSPFSIVLKSLEVARLSTLLAQLPPLSVFLSLPDPSPIPTHMPTYVPTSLVTPATRWACVQGFTRAAWITEAPSIASRKLVKPSALLTAHHLRSLEQSRVTMSDRYE